MGLVSGARMETRMSTAIQSRPPTARPPMARPVVAIVGATGAVGVTVLRCLWARKFQCGRLRRLASAKSAGKVMRFTGSDITVEELTESSFAGVDIALFSAGGSISRRYGPIAAEAGAVVVDNSSAFRMDPNVP